MTLTEVHLIVDEIRAAASDAEEQRRLEYALLRSFATYLRQFIDETNADGTIAVSSRLVIALTECLSIEFRREPCIGVIR